MPGWLLSVPVKVRAPETHTGKLCLLGRCHACKLLSRRTCQPGGARSPRSSETASMQSDDMWAALAMHASVCDCCRKRALPVFGKVQPLCTCQDRNLKDNAVTGAGVPVRFRRPPGGRLCRYRGDCDGVPGCAVGRRHRAQGAAAEAQHLRCRRRAGDQLLQRRSARALMGSRGGDRSGSA